MQRVWKCRRLANGTRLEISAALSLPALSCVIGALR
jgi:hypothetical protein